MHNKLTLSSSRSTHRRKIEIDAIAIFSRDTIDDSGNGVLCSPTVVIWCGIQNKGFPVAGLVIASSRNRDHIVLTPLTDVSAGEINYYDTSSDVLAMMVWHQLSNDVLPGSLFFCDEITSALDTVVAKSILALLRDLQNRIGVSYLSVSHDISTIIEMADTIAVMRDGKVVEYGSTTEVMTPPHHPYTRLLLNSVPEMRTDWIDNLTISPN